jgi:hypothetical protein
VSVLNPLGKKMSRWRHQLKEIKFWKRITFHIGPLQYLPYWASIPIKKEKPLQRQSDPHYKYASSLTLFAYILSTNPLNRTLTNLSVGDNFAVTPQHATLTADLFVDFFCRSPTPYVGCTWSLYQHIVCITKGYTSWAWYLHSSYNHLLRFKIIRCNGDHH